MLDLITTGASARRTWGILRLSQTSKLILLVAVISLVGAILYDRIREKISGYSNEPQWQTLPAKPSLPEVMVKNPIELQNAQSTKPGHPEDLISVTQLVEDFSRNEKEARQKYIGKTYIIKGLIGETFEVDVKGMEHPSLLDRAFEPSQYTKPITAGVMLIADTNDNKQIANGRTLPITVRADLNVNAFERLYAELLKAQNPGFKPSMPYRRSFLQYSDDYSFRSRFGGVYCMFATVYSWRRLDPEGQNETLTAMCKILDYKKDGSEEIEQYKLPDKASSRTKTKARVIAVGCAVINQGIEQHKE